MYFTKAEPDRVAWCTQSQNRISPSLRSVSRRTTLIRPCHEVVQL